MKCHSDFVHKSSWLGKQRQGTRDTMCFLFLNVSSENQLWNAFSALWWRNGRSTGVDLLVGPLTVYYEGTWKQLQVQLPRVLYFKTVYHPWSVRGRSGLQIDHLCYLSAIPLQYRFSIWFIINGTWTGQCFCWSHCCKHCLSLISTSGVMFADYSNCVWIFVVLFCPKTESD